MQSAASEDLRSQLHRMWAAVAPSWEQHADYVDARGAMVTEKMLDLAAPRRGERVLELACGPGGLGLAAAERITPGGEAVLSDVVVEMTQIAAARAAAAGLANVTTLQLDIEHIDQPDESYDLVLCREGLMFAPDPALAAGEIARVLRRGGRTAIAVWGPRERNPWLGVVLDSVAAQLDRPVPPPGVPGPFSLDDADELTRLIGDAGLSDIAVLDVPVPMQVASFDEWWARTCALAGPLSRVLASLPEQAVRAVRERAREAVRPYETAAGLEFPGVTLLATARRP